MEELNEQQKIILRVVYTNYESEISFLLKKVCKKTIINHNQFREALNFLEEKGLLVVKEIDIGIKFGRRVVILTTDKGRTIASTMFKKVVKEKEADKFNREYGLEHGYYSKAPSLFLKENNFKIDTDFKDNKPFSSDFYIEKDNEKYLFNLEHMKSPREDIKEKLDKYLSLINNDIGIGKTIFIITPSVKYMEDLAFEVNNWSLKQSTTTFIYVNGRELTIRCENPIIKNRINVVFLSYFKKEEMLKLIEQHS